MLQTILGQTDETPVKDRKLLSLANQYTLELLQCAAGNATGAPQPRPEYQAARQLLSLIGWFRWMQQTAGCEPHALTLPAALAAAIAENVLPGHMLIDLSPAPEKNSG